MSDDGLGGTWVHAVAPEAHYPSRKAFARWLVGSLHATMDDPRRVFSGGGVYDLLCEEAHGKFAVTPSDADDELRRAGELGWLIRGGCSASPSRRAFLGLTHRKGPVPTFYASAFDWLVTPDEALRLDAAQWALDRLEKPW